MSRNGWQSGQGWAVDAMAAQGARLDALCARGAGSAASAEVDRTGGHGGSGGSGQRSSEGGDKEWENYLDEQVQHYQIQPSRAPCTQQTVVT